MGGGTYDHNAYRAFSQSTVGKSTQQIYTARSIKKELDPNGVKVRESRDSDEHPASRPIIVALDVTGSMGILADRMAREGLGVLFQAILDRKPVTDPQIMFAAIGDMNCDRAPLQVSQFESDNRVVEQLTQIYLEQGGGGNGSESYHGIWYFAANHTVHDAYEKRSQRGYLFTIGDEPPPRTMHKEHVKDFIGDSLEVDLDTKELLEQAQRFYDVYHIIVEEGSHVQHHGLEAVRAPWRELLGEKAIVLSDYTKMSELIVSIIEMAEGVALEESAKRWGGKTADVVRQSLRALPPGGGSIARPRLTGRGA